MACSPIPCSLTSATALTRAPRSKAQPVSGALNPDLKILGVEIEKERVEAALPYADEKTFFRLGGFNLPLKEGEHVRLIRAFNVLRQYEEKDFAPAYERLAQYVLPGGLMIEGTSTPLWTDLVCECGEEEGEERWNDGPWTMEALVFSTNFRLGFEITDFQAVLPKNYIHHVVPGRADLRFLRGVETVRGADCRHEDLWIKAVVRPRGGGAGTEGV